MKLSAHILILEAALVICWSSGFIGAKLASDANAIYSILFWRFAITFAVLTPFVLIFFSKKINFFLISTQLLIGVFAMFGYLVFGVTAVDLGVPLGTGALIFSLQPLVTALAAGLFLNESLTLKQWLGLVISFLGIALAVGGSLGDAALWAFSFPVFGMLSIVIASIISKSLQLRHKSVDMPIVPALWVQSFISAILFAPFIYIFESAMPLIDQKFMYAIAWFVIFSTIGAYGCYWMCLKYSTATRVANLIYLTPPVIAIWAWLMFSEEMAAITFLGFSICIFGVLIFRHAGKKTQA